MLRAPCREPPFDYSYWRSTSLEPSMLSVRRCARWGIPDVAGGLEARSGGSANFWTAVAIKQRYPGHARQAGLAAVTAAAGSPIGRYVVVVDEDVNVEDLEEVICVRPSTRTDPATSIQIVHGTPSNPLDPMIGDLTQPWVTSRAVVNVCRPYDRRNTFPCGGGRGSAGLAAQVRAKWGARLGWTR